MHVGFLAALASPLVALGRAIVFPARRCLGDGCGMWESMAMGLLLLGAGVWALYATATTVAVAGGDRRAGTVAEMHMVTLTVLTTAGGLVAAMGRC